MLKNLTRATPGIENRNIGVLAQQWFSYADSTHTGAYVFANVTLTVAGTLIVRL